MSAPDDARAADMFFLLALLTVTFSPPAPTVGDPVRIVFPATVTLEPSDAYEIVEQKGNTVVVRTFRPAPLLISGRSGNSAFRDLVIPVRSVLPREERDPEPAPLASPRPIAASPGFLPAMAIGGALALIAWLSALLLSRPRRTAGSAAVSPDAAFRAAVEALLQRADVPGRWARLADATRAWLASTRPELGSELTSTELLRRAGEEREPLTAILRQGDLEKFSTRGAEAESFESVARIALELADARARRLAAAAAQQERTR